MAATGPAVTTGTPPAPVAGVPVAVPAPTAAATAAGDGEPAAMGPVAVGEPAAPAAATGPTGSAGLGVATATVLGPSMTTGRLSVCQPQAVCACTYSRCCPPGRPFVSQLKLKPTSVKRSSPRVP